MKKIIAILVLVFALSTTTCFASNNISVNIDDGTYKIPVSFDTAPVIENGRVYVPARAIFEAFGMRMEWDNITKTMYAISNFDEYCTELTIGENVGLQYQFDVNYAERNDENAFEIINKYQPVEIWMDQPAKIINGRTMVPLRAMANLLGCEVDWNNTTKTVTLYTYDYPIDEEVTYDTTTTNEYPPISDEQKAINNQYVELFDTPVDSYPGAFQ